MAEAAPTTNDGEASELIDRLRAQVGSTGTPRVARDPVNQPTIRNWCDAISETNPLFVDEAAARTGPHGGLVAPPAMLNVWTMTGLVQGRPPSRDLSEPASKVHALLDEAGFTGVVATNSDQVYHRYLRPGDLLTQQQKLLDVSPEKQTALGAGHFVTTEAEFTDQNHDPVGSLFLRVLKFRPGTARARPVDPKRQALLDVGLDPDQVIPEKPRPDRPRPEWNQDQAWHWEGLRQRELRIQRFVDDGTLLHPPANANPRSHAMEYDWVVASGRGTLYSYTVVHHPEVPAFDYPLIVGLVELEEGVRIISNVVGVRPDQAKIGMPLQVHFIDSHDDVTLHQFRPADPTPNRRTLTGEDVSVGDELPLRSIPLDPLLIVSAALATRDFQDVHHNRDVAVAKGSKDIFMNILTTSGICNAWLGAWAGPEAIFRSLRIGLGVPNYPYDLMTLSGSVTAIDGGVVTVGFEGVNSLGAHVTGTAELELPEAG